MPGGRPSKLTPEVQKRLCDAVRQGNYLTAACVCAGITFTTFRKWYKRGKDANSGRYAEFVKAVTRAQAESEAALVAEWRKQVKKDWRAARDLLARRFPQRWMSRERHEHVSEVKAKLEVVETVVHTRADAQTVLSRLSAAGGLLERNGAG